MRLPTLPRSRPNSFFGACNGLACARRSIRSLKESDYKAIVSQHIVRIVGFCAALFMLLHVDADPNLQLRFQNFVASAQAKGRQIPKIKISSEEAAHNAHFDKSIAPLLNHDLSEDDGKRIKDAFAAINKRKPERAAKLHGEITDPVGAKLVKWYRLNRGYGTAEDYQIFLKNNPNWPQSHILVQRLEEALFIQGGSAAKILEYFKTGQPKTGVGLAALASAHLALGDTDKAKRFASEAWRSNDLPTTLETGFLKRFSKLLGPDDHKWRFDRLIIDDFRWKSERNERAKKARRMIPLLNAAERTKAQARLAVFLRSRSGLKRVAKFAKKDPDDWSLNFHRIQALRRAKKYDQAAKLLLKAPTDLENQVNPDGWWKERRANAYKAMARGKFKLAYDLVRDSGPLSVNPLNAQRFLAGWIAFAKLKKPKLAQKHFEAMTKSADGPKTRSRSNYWTGRTFDALGDANKAKLYYSEATKDPDAFHAMLAAIKLDPRPQSIVIKPPDRPTDTERDNFLALDPAKALVIANKAQLPHHIQRLFMVNLRNVVKSEAELALTAHLARSLGDTQMSLRIAKVAVGRRKNLYYYAYPIGDFPAYDALRDPPETALLLGVVRQETEFNTKIVSSAGAKGLMQVMTITARHVCQDYKIKCQIKRLLTDPSYNAKIGSAYIGDRMREFQGSYVLTLSGYNAGPGRTRQWIRQFGDPRTPAIDPLDWIERIPFEETRAYVGKVLANIQMYRARLGQNPALRLAQDLERGRRK